MPQGQIDIQAKLRAFPYVAPPGAGARAAAQQEAEEISDFISELQQGVNAIPTDITSLLTGGPTSNAVGQDEWKRPELADSDDVLVLVKTLNKALGTLDNVVSALQSVLSIIQLFINGFNSFSKLIVSGIDLVQNKLNEYTDTTLTTGVFANVIAPPAFLQGAENKGSQMNQSKGGFDGFITRLRNSVNNTQDDNRPRFGIQDYVGGLVFIVDSESLDDIWTGLKQLAGFFDFMQLFGLNLSPPPPINLNGFSGYFSDPENTDKEKFGIQLEWNSNYTASAFNVYRSRVPGGQTEIVPYVPTSLVPNRETGEPGLLQVAYSVLTNIWRKQPFILPEREEQVYKDPDFNDGKPVLVKASFGKNEKLVDQFIKTEKKVIQGQTYEIPYYEENGEKIPVVNYYYIIRSCDKEGENEGPDSKELCVAVRTCNDNYNIADLITHPSGQVELFSMGYGKINNWSSIQISGMIPWFTEVIDIMNQLLNSLRGTVVDASDSFSDFLDQIKSKITMYSNLLKVVSWIIQSINNFLLGSSIAMLSLGPVKGGTQVFVDRVAGAQVPDDGSFSGPNGTTIGLVIMYGDSGINVASIKALKKAFDFVFSLFVKD